MTYEQALYETISRNQAKAEVEDHGLTFDELIQDLGNKSEYKASDVLAWLGY